MYIKFSVRLLNTKNIIKRTQTFNVYSQSTILKYLLKIKKLTAFTFQHNMPRVCLLRLGNKIIKRAHTHTRVILACIYGLLRYGWQLIYLFLCAWRGCAAFLRTLIRSLLSAAIFNIRKIVKYVYLVLTLIYIISMRDFYGYM